MGVQRESYGVVIDINHSYMRAHEVKKKELPGRSRA